MKYTGISVEDGETITGPGYGFNKSMELWCVKDENTNKYVAVEEILDADTGEMLESNAEEIDDELESALEVIDGTETDAELEALAETVLAADFQIFEGDLLKTLKQGGDEPFSGLEMGSGGSCPTCGGPLNTLEFNGVDVTKEMKSAFPGIEIYRGLHPGADEHDDYYVPTVVWDRNTHVYTDEEGGWT